MGILSLLQLIIDLSFSTTVAIPGIVTSNLGSQYRRINKSYISYGYNTGNDLEDKLEPVVAWCAYQLQASRIFAKIAKDDIDDLDEELVNSLKEAIGESFFTATTDPQKASLEFRGFFGLDPFSSTRRSLAVYSEKEDAKYYIDEILSKNRAGAISKLYDHESRTMYVHDYDIKVLKKSGN